VEVDHLLRARVSASAARAFLVALVRREHAVAHLSDGLLRRAVEFDTRFASLGLGFVDGTVMALAERLGLPILTFDFRDFRATAPARGHWRLVVDEAGYRAAVS
jgi:predicted nucleic acid-binding protein